MSSRTLTTVTAAVFLLLAASPAAAQERGTIEFGGFGSLSNFDDELRMDNGFGGGFRVGAFVFPRLSVEFDVSRKHADRPDGLRSVDAETFAARLTGVPLKFGPMSVLLGAGAAHTDVQNDLTESEGFQGLVGLKVGLGSSAALRLEGVTEFNEDDVRNQALQMGVSLYRHPGGRETAPAPQTPPRARAEPQRTDSVSAAETRRLRAVERRYRALRDSLAAGAPTLTDSDRATLIETIYFQHDQSALSDTAQSILRAKVPVFRANPDLRIVVTGYASEPGKQGYNMSLGLRRAEATRDYLVSQGIARSRIDIVTRGEGDQLVVEGSVDVVEAANRRAEFKILMAEPGAP